MPIDITIPRLGWNMDEGVFIAWLKNDGDLVKSGEPIFSLETDKAVQEIESLDAGILRFLPSGPKGGETLAVGTVIAQIIREDEAGHGEERLIASDNSSSTAPPATKARSSPRARRRARELGVDWTGLVGSGRDGRVRERDVLAAASTRKPAHVATAPPLSQAEFTAIPIDATRRTIADRMMQSAHGTAPVTLTTTIDATNLVNLRRQFKAVSESRREGAEETVVGYTDIVVKLTALALQKHPLMNSCWDGERILLYHGIHIGLAVDTEAGLLVPVIRDVPALSLREVAARSRDLIDRARGRRLKAEELHGGTFSVTNLGPFGVEAFTPIISSPQCAVLGLGRIHSQPVVSQQQLASRDRMTLSLTFDHRIVDGAPAARFLQTLSNLLENPSPWLVS
jgi:pyruvate dehydrogenase E2 component (dihydrolipoamide acetyltransferase)